MFVEIVVGYLSDSLGLISDAGHMFFDNASLFIGLYASYMSKWPRDSTFTYGYSRYETVAGFVNAIFLIFVGVSVVFEAVERLWEPPEVHGEHLLTVSVLGMCVNLIGLVFFHDFAHGHSHAGPDGGHGHSHGGEACSGHGHGGGSDKEKGKEGPSAAASAHHNENMQGVFLHVLADTLGSLGVIISSLLIKLYGWNLADPIASLFISVLILLSVVPLIKATAWTLLSRVPPEHEDAFRRALEQVSRLPDVAAVENPHFWKQHGDHLVATMTLRVHASNATIAGVQQKVLRQTQGIMRSAGVKSLTVQIELETAAAAGAGEPSSHHVHSLPSPASSSLPAAPMAFSSSVPAPAPAPAPSLVTKAIEDDHGSHHGHSHAHSHSHGHGHGHSHGASHHHEAEEQAPPTKKADSDSGHSHGSHGHSHGGVACTGHGHGAATTEAAPAEPPAAAPPARSHSHGSHGHSHGGAPCGGHGHS
jgi:solute carrier family 30 (zinc transporter), member 5/7